MSSRPRMRQDQQFWHIVKDLKWKLDDGNSGLPPAEPEFGYGPGRRRFSMLATHLAAFLLGGIAFAVLLTAPAVLPILIAGGAVGAVVTHQRLR